LPARLLGGPCSSLAPGRDRSDARNTTGAGRAGLLPAAFAPGGRAAQPGDLARPLTGAAALPGAAENLLVLYHSTTLAGQDTAVSGTISIPAGQPPTGGWPVLSWAHGTTGIADI